MAVFGKPLVLSPRQEHQVLVDRAQQPVPGGWAEGSVVAHRPAQLRGELLQQLLQAALRDPPEGGGLRAEMTVSFRVTISRSRMSIEGPPGHEGQHSWRPECPTGLRR